MSDDSHFPIVYRVAALRVENLGAVRFHGERTGGDLSHITPPEQYDAQGRMAPISFIYDKDGNPVDDESGTDWVKGIRDEVKEAAAFNTQSQVENLKENGKQKEARRRERQGDKPPFWTGRNGGAPLREMLVSAKAAFFQDSDGAPGQWDWKRVQAFAKRSVQFLEKEWGAALRYVRLDLDEEGPHLHAVAAPWVETTTATGARQKRLAATKLDNYETEAAQDRAGEFFEPLGLKRGKRDALARREAKARGEVPQPPKAHVPPSDWRRAKARDLATKEAALEAREAKARQALAVVARVDPGLLEERGDVGRAQAVREARQMVEKRQEDKAAAMARAASEKGQRAAEAARKEAIAKAARAKAAKAKAKAKARYQG